MNNFIKETIKFIGLSAGLIGLIVFIPWIMTYSVGWWIMAIFICGMVVLTIFCFMSAPAAKSKLEPRDIQSTFTSTTNIMERQLLEELVILNRKQHYWIRAVGIIYVIIPLLYSLGWVAAFFFRGASH